MAFANVRELTGAANASGPASISVTVPAAGCAQFNLVVVGFLCADSATPPSVADTQGNTWTKLTSVAVNTNTRTSHTYLYYSRLTTALVSGNTITATLSGMTGMAGVGREFSGNTASTEINQETQATGASTTPASGAINTTVADALLVGVVGARGNNSAPTFTQGTGWTNGTIAQAGVGAPGHNESCVMEYRVVSATGSYNADGTYNITRDWGAIIAAFAEPASVAATGNFFRMF